MRIMLFLVAMSIITPAFASQPNEIMQTNITGEGFAISWITNASGTGAVLYGQGTNSINQIATDNHSGHTHHIALKDLSPNTTYYYDIISGGTTTDKGGQHYCLSTGPSSNDHKVSDLVYGWIYKDNLTVATDAIVYVQINNLDGNGSLGSSSTWSTVVDDSGSWNIDLSNIRTNDLSRLFDYSSSGDSLSIFVQGGIDETGRRTVNTANDSLCLNITISTDTTAPRKIGTLQSVGTAGLNSVVLQWTAPG
ncbi:MAG: fibronectin type III domain-containing protein, partial [bacterium]